MVTEAMSNAMQISEKSEVKMEKLADDVRGDEFSHIGKGCPMEAADDARANAAGKKSYDYAGDSEGDFRLLAEDFYWSLSPSGVVPYVAGYCLSVFYMLWSLKTCLGSRGLGLLRFANGNSWSLLLMAVLTAGMTICLYARARGQDTHDVADGATDGALMVGVVAIPAAARISVLVPLAAVVLVAMSFVEVRSKIREEALCPWGEPLIPVVTCACSLLKRLSGVSIAFVLFSVVGLV